MAAQIWAHKNTSVRCAKLIVLGPGCPIGFIHTICLTAQGLDGQPVYLLNEFMRYRFKLFQDMGGLIKPCAGRNILQTARKVASDRRKLREHAAALVSRFAQARRVLITQPVPERGKMLRDASGERLTHFSE
jgi:hypothetical protein